MPLNLRGERLRAGALVCAAGADGAGSRELDNVVLEHATLVCCDSLAAAKRVAADLAEPVDAGVLDWLEVHGLHDVVGGQLRGRESGDDVVLFKSTGSAAPVLAVAARVFERARMENGR